MRLETFHVQPPTGSQPSHSEKHKHQCGSGDERRHGNSRERAEHCRRIHPSVLAHRGDTAKPHTDDGREQQRGCAPRMAETGSAWTISSETVRSLYFRHGCMIGLEQSAEARVHRVIGVCVLSSDAKVAHALPPDRARRGRTSSPVAAIVSGEDCLFRPRAQTGCRARFRSRQKVTVTAMSRTKTNEMMRRRMKPGIQSALRRPRFAGTTEALARFIKVAGVNLEPDELCSDSAGVRAFRRRVRFRGRDRGLSFRRPIFSRRGDGRTTRRVGRETSRDAGTRPRGSRSSCKG